MVLYRKYRPQKFADLFGQEEIARTLVSQLEAGKVGHGYLFSGPKGTGKTSAARILAKAVNCKNYQKPETESKKQKFGEPCNKCLSCVSITDGSNLDLIEIDAASNRNIDDVREIREKIRLAPVSSKFKVYIIDEVHMLTKEAFNALLKTLEEPPAHVIFVLCTTEVQKLPATIISRVQRFNFRRASDDDIKRAILKVAKNEGIRIDDKAVLFLIRASDGSFRDAISFLDQVSSTGKSVTVDVVSQIVRASTENGLYDLIENLHLGRVKEAVELIENYWEAGVDFNFLVRELVLLAEKILLIKLGINNDEKDTQTFAKMEKLAGEMSFFKLQEILKVFLAVEGEMKFYPLPHIALVLACCKFITGQDTPGLPVNDESALKVLETAGEVEVVKEKKSIGKKVFGISEFEKSWDEFLKKVKVENAHVMAILKSTRPISVEGDILILEVFYRFHKDKLEEIKTITMLESILKGIIGKSARLKFVLGKRESNPPKSVRQSDVIDTGENNLERLATEIFSK